MTDTANHRNTKACLTLSDFKTLGRNEFAYVRQYQVNGQHAFVLHAADGTALAVQKEAANAILSAQTQNLEIVSVH